MQPCPGFDLARLQVYKQAKNSFQRLFGLWAVPNQIFAGYMR
jgi:hypothetical protein